MRGRAMEISRLAVLGSDQWTIDPEGNQFLILIRYLLKGSDFEVMM